MPLVGLVPATMPDRDPPARDHLAVLLVDLRHDEILNSQEHPSQDQR